MCFGTKFAKFQSFETWSRTSSPFLTRASELQSHKRGYELIEWEENGSTLELEEGGGSAGFDFVPQLKRKAWQTILDAGLNFVKVG